MIPLSFPAGMVRAFVLLALLLTACGHSKPEKKKTEAPPPVAAPLSISTYEYGALSIPDFFAAMIRNHIQDFAYLDTGDYEAFCRDNNLDPRDTQNFNSFYPLQILHDLFTSEDAVTCSHGRILYIPYFWHYLDPNPRYRIRFVRDGRLLKDTAPPAGFSRYGSYADIDRTPYLFLSDLVSPTPRYYAEGCDTFCTFGWCSEREMAFTALLTLMGYEARIQTGIAHTWTEAAMHLRKINGETQYFLVTLDNTFNIYHWRPVREEALEEWRHEEGEGRLARWYSRQASSPAELEKIKKHIVPPEARQRIEESVVTYLRKVAASR